MFVPTTPVNCSQADTKKAPWLSPRLATVVKETAKRLQRFAGSPHPTHSNLGTLPARVNITIP